MIRHLSLCSAALFASVFAVGCSGKAAEEDSADEIASIAEALERDEGGLNRDAEPPAFGDADADGAIPLSDAANDEEEVLGRAAAEAPRAKLYRLALVWGHMPAPRGEEPAPAPADFSGGIAVERGAIGVSRAIRFDDRDRLEPRTSPAEVRFVSHTLPHVDGLLVSVRIPEGASTILRFRTAALDADIDVATLQDSVGGLVRASGGDQGLSYIGFEDRPGCASGFLIGRWHDLPTRRELGRFHGRVVGDRGAALGHVRGIWGHARRADKDVFFGKYIDRAGEFRGLFGGGYGEGELRGAWGAREPNMAGALRGYYSDGYVRDDGRGVFLSRFQERCQ